MTYRVFTATSMRIVLALSGGLFSLTARGAVLAVLNTSDSGVGSLRQAIIDSNNGSGTNLITFAIGAGGQTISPLSALPSITTAVVIDGTTQPGFLGSPLIEINGASAGAASIGLRLFTTNCTVRGLVINRFAAQGMLLQGASGHTIKGNFIGTDATGAIARGNGSQGIWLNGSSSNTIGGTNTADRNVISGNGDAGVYIQNGGGNTIIGNYIGTSAGGTNGLANGNNGIALVSSQLNQIGGTNVSQRNLISGNSGSGIYLNNSGATLNLIQGNYIGTDVSGSLSISNIGDGITISGASGNTIGGSITGACNVISGNGQGGISISGPGASNNNILGNYVGTSASGLTALGNSYAGITLMSANSNSIGGSLPGSGNIISANKKDGVFISTNSTGNVIEGNYIGLDVAGANALGNAFNGVTISSANSNTIGGARNIISGNANHGVQIVSGATGNSLQGNYVGTDALGSHAKGNSIKGVRIESAANTIGGMASTARNIISGNADDGIYVFGAPASNNIVQGNYVGLDANGTAALPNGRAGVGISGAAGNLVGGTSAGQRNIISTNVDAGIYLLGAGTTGNQIQGNYIGTDFTGTQRLGNGLEGIFIATSANNNTIGGAASGAGNLIAANATRGIWLSNASFNVIQRNMIGTNLAGSAGLGNVAQGVECASGAGNNTIGGAAGLGNTIAYSQTAQFAGVRIRDGVTNVAILGNSIFGNGGLGIDLGATGPTANVSCGGTTANANLGQNYPVVTQAVSGAGIIIKGTFNGKANTANQLQFFANPSCDPAGYGQGQYFLGSTNVTTAGNCNASFAAVLPVSVPAGYSIAATATDPNNNTSEFSYCVSGAAVTPVPLVLISYPTNHQFTLSWTNTGVTFALEKTGSLMPPVHWSSMTSTQMLSGGKYFVTLPSPTTNVFYRLSFE
ncbi:MAG: hypothetical protein C5B50_28185 [Verrucomicrobia bacterium]|nr:MAG: hypothetical protein C5B50_28185 [Verrucomicrobiota bacterium]